MKGNNMVVPVNPINPNGVQPKGKNHQVQNSASGEFINTFKTAAKNIYEKVPEALAPFKDDLRKKKISEEREWLYEEDEDNEDVNSLVQKIEQRLKKLARMSGKEMDS